jgi:hypothetical protein
MTERFKRVLVDNDTGEVLSEKTLEYNLFDDETGYLFWKNKDNIRMFPGIILPKGLNDSDKSNLITLSHSLLKNANMIAYRGYQNDIKPMTIEQMAEECELKPKTMYALIRRAIDLGVMARVTVMCGNLKETQFYMNPIYFFTGSRINLNLYLLFRKQLDRYLPDWVKEKFAAQAKAMKLSMRDGKKRGRPKKRKNSTGRNSVSRE